MSENQYSGALISIYNLKKYMQISADAWLSFIKIFVIFMHVLCQLIA